MRRLPALVAVFLLISLPAWGQAPGAEIEIIDINAGRYADGGRTAMVIDLRNLGEEPDLALLEITANGQPVSNLEVAPLRESAVPLGVVLVIDVSGSMEGEPLEAAKAAANQLASQGGPGDQFALITFADQVTVASGFTSNISALNERINAMQAGGEEAALYDAVVRGINMFGALSVRDLVPNMVVLSAAEDTASQVSLQEAVAAVGESDVRVFSVALESAELSLGPLEQIAAAGNGPLFSAPDPGQLTAIYGQIDQEISNTLVARFNSPVFTPGDVEFTVGYGGLSASQTLTVAGFATTTTAGATTTTTLAPLTPRVVESTLPLDIPTLMLIGAAGVGLTVFLFMIILFGRDEEEGQSRFAKRLQAYGRRGGHAEEKRPFLERIPLLNRFTQAAEEEVRRRGLLSGVNSTLEQANIPMSPGEAILALLGLAAVGGVFLGILNGTLWGVIGFAGLLLLAVAGIRFTGSREKKRFERQLPDTLTLMSTSLRAGYSLLQATEAVANEAQNPTAREFGRAIVESRLGRSVSDALNGIVERTQSKDFEWAVMAIEIQREVGGNLAEVLQTVADTMRARNRLKGEIQALTAEGRISAIVLGALPFVLALFLWTTNRSYLQPLLDTTFGRIAIGVGLLLMAAGIFWLKKIVDIKI